MTGRPTRRFVTAVLAWAAGALVAAGAVPAAAAEVTPYATSGELRSPNPAVPIPGWFRLDAGPVSAEIDSSRWTLQQMIDLAQSGNFQSTLASFPPEDERVSLGGYGRASVSLFGVQLSYSPLTATGGGTVKGDVIRLLKDFASGTPSPPYTFDGTLLDAVFWSEFSARTSLPVPFAARLLGIRQLRVGAGLHLLQGRNFGQAEGTGTIDPPSGPTDGSVTLTTRTEGSGTAYDVGVLAGVRPWLALEAAYVGSGSIHWPTGTKERFSWDAGANTIKRDVTPAGPLTYQLPATVMTAAHIRPLALLPVRVTIGYARVGANKPDGFERLNGEVGLGLGPVETAFGILQDQGQTSRLYAHLGFRLGPYNLAVRAVNLQELGNPGGARNLGVSVATGFAL